jgi:hypothetical protein
LLICQNRLRFAAGAASALILLNLLFRALIALLVIVIGIVAAIEVAFGDDFPAISACVLGHLSVLLERNSISLSRKQKRCGHGEAQGPPPPPPPPPPAPQEKIVLRGVHVDLIAPS